MCSLSLKSELGEESGWSMPSWESWNPIGLPSIPFVRLLSPQGGTDLNETNVAGQREALEKEKHSGFQWEGCPRAYAWPRHVRAVVNTVVETLSIVLTKSQHPLGFYRKITHIAIMAHKWKNAVKFIGFSQSPFQLPNQFLINSPWLIKQCWSIFSHAEVHFWYWLLSVYVCDVGKRTESKTKQDHEAFVYWIY